MQELREIQQTISTSRVDGEGVIGNVLGYEIEYGITDRFQLSAGYSREHQHYPQMRYSANWLEAGTMFGFINQPGQALAISLEAEFLMNSPEVEGEETETEETSFSPALLYGRQFGAVQLHFQGGAEVQQEEHSWIYNVAAVYGTGVWHPLLEVNGEHSEEGSSWYLAPGLVLNNESGWEFIAGYRHMLSDAEWEVSLKLLYEFTAGKNKD